MKRLGSVALSMVLGTQLGCHSSSSRDAEVEPTTMVELISTPTRFEGKLIGVFGFYGGFHSCCLALTKDHADFGMDSSVQLVDEASVEISKACAGHYVFVVGKFTRLAFAGRSLDNFQITDIKEVAIRDQGDPTICWRRTDIASTEFVPSRGPPREAGQNQSRRFEHGWSSDQMQRHCVDREPNEQLQPTPYCNAATRGWAFAGAAELRR